MDTPPDGSIELNLPHTGTQANGSSGEPNSRYDTLIPESSIKLGVKMPAVSPPEITVPVQGKLRALNEAPALTLTFASPPLGVLTSDLATLNTAPLLAPTLRTEYLELEMFIGFSIHKVELASCPRDERNRSALFAAGVVFPIAGLVH